MEVQLSRSGGGRPLDLHWRGIVASVLAALVLGGASGAIGRHYLNASVARPLPGAVTVHAMPVPTITVGPGTEVTPAALPDHMLLQVPFTTQAPLNNWAQHQESCEAANLTMLFYYWTNRQDVVIDPHAADNLIGQIDRWKPAPDLNDTMLGELAQQHLGYTYRIVPNDPKVIAEQLSAGRPLLAEVRTHGLGNSHYPGYAAHFEQTGWSVPHFVTIIGYDSSGVWLNDPGISAGRGYHISYAQLTHAIDDLDQHHPALSQGQVLLLIAPVATPKVRTGSF
jgi:peptidase C39-like protein